jgi:hypothetical protein
MLKKFLIVWALAAGFSVGLGAGAQQKPATQAAPTGKMVHYEGCVYPKRQLSAAKPIMVLRGSVEDYVLTGTRDVLATGTTEGGGGGPIYKLEEVPQDRLRELIGKRVGVTGHINEKPEPRMQVISIREVVGACMPPAPASR